MVYRTRWAHTESFSFRIPRSWCHPLGKDKTTLILTGSLWRDWGAPRTRPAGAVAQACALDHAVAGFCTLTWTDEGPAQGPSLLHTSRTPRPSQRRGCRGHRPQRLPQSDQQRARIPRGVPRPPRRPKPDDHRGDADRRRARPRQGRRRTSLATITSCPAARARAPRQNSQPAHRSWSVFHPNVASTVAATTATSSEPRPCCTQLGADVALGEIHDFAGDPTSSRFSSSLGGGAVIR